MAGATSARGVRAARYAETQHTPASDILSLPKELPQDLKLHEGVFVVYHGEKVTDPAKLTELRTKLQTDEHVAEAFFKENRITAPKYGGEQRDFYMQHPILVAAFAQHARGGENSMITHFDYDVLPLLTGVLGTIGFSALDIISEARKAGLDGLHVGFAGDLRRLERVFKAVGGQPVVDALRKVRQAGLSKYEFRDFYNALPQSAYYVEQKGPEVLDFFAEVVVEAKKAGLNSTDMREFYDQTSRILDFSCRQDCTTRIQKIRAARIQGDTMYLFPHCCLREDPSKVREHPDDPTQEIPVPAPPTPHAYKTHQREITSTQKILWLALTEAELKTPSLSDDHLALHAMPHIMQKAAERGMSLEEYHMFLQKPENLAQDRKWIRKPYDPKQKDGGDRGGSGGIEVGAISISESRTIRRELEQLIRDKAAKGELRLRLKSCGCGETGSEAYGLAVMAQDILHNVGTQTLGADATPAEVDAWVRRWDVKTTGYAIDLMCLSTAENAELEFRDTPEKADKLRGKYALFKYASYEGRDRGGRIPSGEYEYHFRYKQAIRDRVNFEWIDLLDGQQTRRLYAEPADLLVLRRTFYIYSKPSFWSNKPVTKALDRIVGSIADGGIFWTDASVSEAMPLDLQKLKQQGIEPPQSLFTPHPDLVEVVIPSSKTERYFPKPESDAFTYNPLWPPLYARYGQEIEAHHGRDPTGIYTVKRKKP